MEVIEGICPRCKLKNYIIKPNNPLIQDGLCIDCINKAIDPNSLDSFAFFCRTYNIPMDTNLYLSILSKYDAAKALEKYIQSLYDNGTLKYSDEITDKWKEVSAEWEKVKTHRQLLDKLAPIKQDFIDRCCEKWGAEYNFDQYLQLGNQFHSIIQTLNVSNPTQIANIQKVCKMSLMVDELIRGGDIKAIADATKALSQLTQIAKIDEMSEVAAEGTIKTVADLYKYMEDHGWEFQYYDQVDRDIVDKTLRDIQDSIRTNLNNAIGLDVTLQTVKENYLRAEEETVEQQAIDETPIEDILDASEFTVETSELDNKFKEEDVIFEDE